MKKLLTALFIATIFFGCKNDSNTPSTEAAIVGITLEKSRNAGLNADVSGTINQTDRSIWFVIPQQFSLSALTPTIICSKGAKTTKTITQINGNAATQISIVSEDGKTTTRYTVKAIVLPQGKPTIDAFRFLKSANPSLDEDVAGVIDHTAKTIEVNIPFAVSTLTLKPEVAYSAETIAPEVKAANFVTPVKYTVSTPDGQKTEYTVTVDAYSPPPALESFGFKKASNPSLPNDVDGVIDHDNKTVTVYVPLATLTPLVPSAAYSNATISPAIDGAVDFSNPVTYTFTGTKNRTVSYTVMVELDNTPAPTFTKLLIDDAPCPFDTPSNTFYYTAKLDGTSSKVRKISAEGTNIHKIVIGNTEAVNGENATFTTFEPKNTFTVTAYNKSGKASASKTLVLTGVPLINLSTANTIIDEPKVSCEFAIIDPQARSWATVNGVKKTNLEYLANEIGIEVRGAYSQGFNKKSFGMEFWGDMEVDGASLLGLREDQDWILDAMFIDESRMRNRVLTDVWNEMSNVPHAALEPDAHNGTRGELVEVFLNNRYHGMYCMTERIDRKQLKCKKYGSATRGVVLKSSSHITSAFDVAHSKPANGTMAWYGFEADYPKAKDGPIDWTYFHQFCQLIATADDATFNAQIFNLLDKANYVDYFIFLQFSYALDNITKNTFWSMYDISSPTGRKVFVTPWDLDATMGANWDLGSRAPYTGGSKIVLGNKNNRNGDSSNLIYRLLKNNPDGFKAAVKARWNQLRGNTLSINNLTAKMQAYRNIQVNSGAAAREITRWNADGSRYSNVDTEITYITNWMTTRITDLDAIFNAY